MITYYIKSAIKSLIANKKFTLLNVIGFAFAISVCLAISLFLLKEYSFDKYHENSDRIVRLIDTKNNSSNIDYRVKDILLENFPKVENACLVYRETYPINISINNKGFYLDDIMSVDNNFFQVFSIPFIEGNSLRAFDNNNSAVITESTAKRLFGLENPIGKEIEIDKETLISITGLIKDFPENSSITAGLLVNAANDEFKFSFACENSDDKSSFRWEFRIYLLLNQDANPDFVAERINANISTLKPYADEIGFLPLTDIYLNDNSLGSQTKKGNSNLLQLLTAIALIILVLAIINYINLILAQQAKRNKNTGIRKSFGAERKNLLFHFLFESVIVSGLSFLLAIFLVWILTAFYSSVFNSRIDIQLLFHIPNLLAILFSIVIIGIISGIVPALILSQTKPTKILSGSLVAQGKKSYFRNSLTIFQFTISIVLIFCVLIVNKQILFVKHKDPGFTEEQLLRLDIPYLPKEDQQKANTLAEELKKSPYIKNLSFTNGVPGNIRLSMGSGVENSDNNMLVPCLIVDTAFISTFQLQIIKGRDLEPGDYGKVCMINQAFYKYFKFDNLNNKKYNNYREGGFDIIGVVKNFHYGSLHNKIEPLCILFADGRSRYQISLRIAANGIAPAMDVIKKTWQNTLPSYPIQYQFYDDWFDQLYQKEERFAKTISLFALLAIAISCFGILGLAIFSSERRTKETGIRKVNGAKTYEIMAMLNKDFAKWVAIAFVIACPIAWYAMHKWLENFAYKTELSWWIFALAGIIAMGIALLTVSIQSWRAATRNPVESLRYE